VQETSSNPDPKSPWVGGAILLMVVAFGAAFWLSQRAPHPGPVAQVGAPVRPVTLPDALPGFRADAWFLPDDGALGFVEIPAGPFLMGSDPQVDPLAYENEIWGGGRAQATVELPDYHIGRYPVTVAQYRAFVQATGFRADPEALEGPLDHPVVSVTWPDALAYARWLEDRLRESPDTPPHLRERLQDGWRLGLPSEAQWEKAARGTDGRVFPWGNEIRPDRANYEANRTMPVGSFPCPECPYGLSDMSGNVWEWTRSPYLPYPYVVDRAAGDLEADALWVMRGGSFGDGARNVRAAIRGGADPGARRPFIGFRLVLSPP